LEHVVDDIVELLGEGVDVLPVERSDERRVQAPQFPGQLVAELLTGDHGIDRGAAPRARLFEQLTQPPAALSHVDGGVVEWSKNRSSAADEAARCSARYPGEHEVNVKWSGNGQARPTRSTHRRCQGVSTARR